MPCVSTDEAHLKEVIRDMIDPDSGLCDGLELTDEIEARLRRADKATITRGDMPRFRSPLCKPIKVGNQKTCHECIALKHNVARRELVGLQASARVAALQRRVRNLKSSNSSLIIMNKAASLP